MPSTGRWRLWTAVSPHGHKLHVVCSLQLAGVQTNGPTVQSEPHFGFYASVLVRAVEGGVVFSGVRTHQTVNILPHNMLICFDKHILRDHCKKRVILAKVLISDIFNFPISASAPRMEHLSGSDENTKTSPGLCCLSECLPPSRLFSSLCSEYQLARPSDSHRKEMLFGSLAKPGHPMGKFCWGKTFTDHSRRKCFISPLMMFSFHFVGDKSVL